MNLLWKDGNKILLAEVTCDGIRRNDQKKRGCSSAEHEEIVKLILELQRNPEFKAQLKEFIEATTR